MRRGTWTRCVIALATVAFPFTLVPRASSQEPDPSQTSPSPDSLRTPVSATPQRLDLTPPAAGPGDAEPKPIPPYFHGKSWLGDQHLDVWARYNRVEGPALHAALVRPLKPDGFVPSFRAQMGYAFSPERGQYFVGFEQPVAPHHRVTVGAEGFRSFLPFYYADESLSSGENSASAFFLHRDYWDWYEAEGLRAFAKLYLTPAVTLAASLREQDEESLENANDWSVFNQKTVFPENPIVPEGEYRGYDLSVAYDTRPRQEEDSLSPRSTWSSWEKWLRLTWERGDGGLGGDFDLWRVTGDLRNYFRLSPNQTLSTRLLAGTGAANDGPLPAARRYEIGGLGTLRGHNYRSLRGDHMALANVQYAFGVGRRGWLLAFLDSGASWDEGTLFDQRIPIDAGAGFRIGHSGPTLLVARSLNESDSEWRVQFRFQESY